MSAIPVVHAEMCVNCETVFDGREHQDCPACASKAVMHLQTVTERGEVSEVQDDPELVHYITPLSEISAD